MPTITQDQVALPPQRKYTIEEYEQIGNFGLFEGERLELVEGNIIEMSPITARHNTYVDNANEVMRRYFRIGYRVRVQSSFIIPGYNEIQPDIAVVRGRLQDFFSRHPDQAALIIEVAETSQEYDMGAKAQLYARAGVEDYWVIDTSRPRLYVHRQPVADSNASYGFRYSSVVELARADTVSPLARPRSIISVTDLLP
ncbi:Uma2 family endonuclease [Nostoc sp. CHAB 5824]|nr:Uma2 family endonuclease [Nostoc sp. CHAB 5824]